MSRRAARAEAEALFQSEGWGRTLADYTAVTHLSVQMYALDGRAVGVPSGPSPLFAVFAGRGRGIALFEECAKLRAKGATVRAEGAKLRAEGATVHDHQGLATISVPLRDAGAEVAIAVAGFALVRHLDEEQARQLADAHNVAFATTWDAIRREMPVSRQRLALCGHLLATLGEALLREEARARQLEETSANLAEALRLKDEFLAVLSHELRTPLAPILSWTQILKHRPDMSRLAEGLEVIERNVRHQIALVDDLLDLNRIQREKLALELQACDLREIVAAAVDNLAPLANGKRLHLERRAPEHPVTVEADAKRLGQVFTNIVSNAIKFTPAGGVVTVAVSAIEDRGVVTVRDTGVGIAPEFLPFVFDMFRQQEEGFRRRHGGLGIGLALARHLTELHRGTIRAASAGAGRGTEITVTLPLAPVGRSTPGPPVQEHLRLLPRLEGLSVLLIEDSEDTSVATARMLQDLGVRVTVALDGQQGLERLQSSPHDLVLCDLRMPTMDGFEFIQRLRARERARPIPVIACSGLASADDVRRVRETGFTAYLRKPFDYEALTAALESARRGVATPRDTAR